MKTISVASASLALTLMAAQAAELRIDCTGGRFFVDYIVAEGDQCSGERNINIDGQQFVEPLPIITNGNRTIPLEPTSTADITAEMFCITPDGFSDFALVAARTQTGCVGVSTTPADPLPPQPAGFPNGVPGEDGNIPSEPIPESVNEVSDSTIPEDTNSDNDLSIDSNLVINPDLVINADLPVGVTLDDSLLQQPNDVIIATLNAVNAEEARACGLDPSSQDCLNAIAVSERLREILGLN